MKKLIFLLRINFLCPVSEPENAHTASHDNEDGTKLLAADYLGLKDTMIDPIEFKTPSLINKDAMKKKSEEFLFYPSSKPGNKIPEFRCF